MRYLIIILLLAGCTQAPLYVPPPVKIEVDSRAMEPPVTAPVLEDKNLDRFEVMRLIAAHRVVIKVLQNQVETLQTSIRKLSGEIK